MRPTKRRLSLLLAALLCVLLLLSACGEKETEVSVCLVNRTGLDLGEIHITSATTDEWGDTEECLDPAKWHPWESCSGISKSYGNHWMESYDPSMVMTEKEFIIHFSDIVARGGNLLLLVNLDPQGAILPFQKERLEQIGRWLETYGEAIYGTRICAPYKTDKVDYTQSKDGKTAYAIVKEPSAEVELACALPAGTAVTVVGADRKLAARRTEKGTTVVSLPADLASAKIPFALRCTR